MDHGSDIGRSAIHRGVGASGSGNKGSDTGEDLDRGKRIRIDEEYFLAPSGAQEMLMFVRLSVCSFV